MVGKFSRTEPGLKICCNMTVDATCLTDEATALAIDARETRSVRGEAWDELVERKIPP